jgi:hypothetical protein
MTYVKPEVHILGSATAVIESMNPKPSNPTDGASNRTHNTPAYDLDE